MPRATRLTTPLAALCLLAADLTGCTIIIRPEVGGGPPVATPLVCVPGSEMPSAHVYFSARIERSTVNLADRYQSLMTDTVLALAGAGIQTTHAVLIRADERPVDNRVLGAWGCNLDSPEDLKPADVIRHYATEGILRESPLGCVLDPLRQTGANLADEVTRYPPQLPGTSGRRIFGYAPDLVLVVHLDGLERRSGFGDPGCTEARLALGGVAADGGVAWLAYQGPNPPPNLTAHWMLATPESVDRATFVRACRQVDGFPADVLDLLEPSPRAVYGPLGQTLASTGARVASLPFCDFLAGPSEFLVQEAVAMARMLGLDVDPARVRQVLAGGLPGLAPPGGGADIARPGP